MAAPTPEEARDNFLYYLSETLSCVTRDDLTAFQQSAKLYKLWFNPPAKVINQAGTEYYVSVAQVFKVVAHPAGGFKVNTQEYSYRFSKDQDISAHGILAYHWHPNDFAVRFPHLHITVTPRTGYPEIERRIRRAHYPTSRVCLEDFVRLLIDYYDIRPRLAASKWKQILRKNKSAFDKEATWKIQP